MVSGGPSDGFAEELPAIDHRLRKCAIVFLVAGVPVLLGAYFTIGNAWLSRAFYATTGVLVVCTMTGALLRPSKTYVGVDGWIYAAFVVWMAVCTLINSYAAPGPLLGAQQIRWYIGWFFWVSSFFLIQPCIRSVSDVRFTASLLDKVGMIVAASVYLGLAGLGETLSYRGGYTRSFGLLGDQVGYVVVLFALRAALYRRWFLLSLHLGAIALTATRGAILALAIGIGIMLVLPRADSSGKSTRMIATIVVVVVLILGLLVTWLPTGLFLQRLVDWDLIALGLRTRLSSIALGTNVLRDHPLVGVGINGFSLVVNQYNPGQYFAVLVKNDIALAGNQLVQTGTDGGFPAIALFLTILLVTLRPLPRLPGHAVGHKNCISDDLLSFRVFILSILIGNQSSVWLWPYSLVGHYIMLACGLLHSYSRMAGITRERSSGRLPGESHAPPEC